MRFFENLTWRFIYILIIGIVRGGIKLSERQALTMEECTDLLGVSKHRVQQLINKGILEPVYRGSPGKSGYRRYISYESVRRYAAENKYHR